MTVVDLEATTEEELMGTAVDSEATIEELRATDEVLMVTVVDSEATTDEEELTVPVVDSKMTTEPLRRRSYGRVCLTQRRQLIRS